jgi:hypothetical protein
MVWRIGGGLMGWLGSLTPLVIVNLLAFTMAMDPGLVSILGGLALALGVALGGLLAGLLGGRRGASWGGAVAGFIAAALLAATLVAVGYVLDARGQLPYLLALHPIRALGATIFLACLVAGVAALTGWLSARRREARWQTQLARATARTTPRNPSRPSSRPGAGSRPLRDPRQPPAYPPYPANPPYPSNPSNPARSSRSSQSAPRGRDEQAHARERSPRW